MRFWRWLQGRTRRLYAALGEGGLLGSGDAGQTWQPVFAS